MDSDDARITLAQHSIQLSEIARNVERLVEVSEKLARMQEREQERDARVAKLYEWADVSFADRKSLDVRVSSMSAWAKGALAIITAIILPVTGAVLWEVLHDIPAIERRIAVLEIQQKYDPIKP